MVTVHIGHSKESSIPPRRGQANDDKSDEELFLETIGQDQTRNEHIYNLFNKTPVRVTLDNIKDPRRTSRAVHPEHMTQLYNSMLSNGLQDSTSHISVCIDPHEARASMAFPPSPGESMDCSILVVDGRHRCAALRRLTIDFEEWRHYGKALTVILWTRKDGQPLSVLDILGLSALLNDQSSNVRKPDFKDRLYASVSAIKTMQESTTEDEHSTANWAPSISSLARDMIKTRVLGSLQARQLYKYIQIALRFSQSEAEFRRFQMLISDCPKFGLVHITSDVLLGLDEEGFILGVQCMCRRFDLPFNDQFDCIKTPFYSCVAKLHNLLKHASWMKNIPVSALLSMTLDLQEEKITVRDSICSQMLRFNIVRNQDQADNRRINTLFRRLKSIIGDFDLPESESHSTPTRSDPRFVVCQRDDEEGENRSNVVRSRVNVATAEENVSDKTFVAQADACTQQSAVQVADEINPVTSERQISCNDRNEAPVLDANYSREKCEDPVHNRNETEQSGSKIPSNALPGPKDLEVQNSSNAIEEHQEDQAHRGKDHLNSPPLTRSNVRTRSMNRPKQVGLGRQRTSDLEACTSDSDEEYNSQCKKISGKRKDSSRDTRKSKKRKRNQPSSRRPIQNFEQCLKSLSEDDIIRVCRRNGYDAIPLTNEVSLTAEEFDECNERAFEDELPADLPVGMKDPDPYTGPENPDWCNYMAKIPSSWPKENPITHLCPWLDRMFIPAEHRANIALTDSQDLISNHHFVYWRASFNYLSNTQILSSTPKKNCDSSKDDITMRWENAMENDEYALFYFGVKRGELFQRGYCIMEGMLDDSSMPDMIQSRKIQKVDKDGKFFIRLRQEMVRSFRDTLPRIGEPGKKEWTTIANTGTENDSLKAGKSIGRFSTTNFGVTEAIEASPGRVWACKARALLDSRVSQVLAALGVWDNVSCEDGMYIPRTGGRWLATSKHCERQQLHTDFLTLNRKDTLMEKGNPGYFAICSAVGEVALWVSPHSHKIVSAAPSQYLTALSYGTIALLEKVPPFSIFIGRGDLYHAGAAFDDLPSDDESIRYHLYFTPESVSLPDAIHVLNQFRPKFCKTIIEDSDEENIIDGEENRETIQINSRTGNSSGSETEEVDSEDHEITFT